MGAGGAEERNFGVKSAHGAKEESGMENIEQLENYEMKIYKELADELSEGAKRVSYEEIARRIGCSRSTVRYNVGKLISARFIGFENGKLYLI